MRGFGEVGETDVAVRAGVDEVEWRKRVVRPEDFGFQEVDGVRGFWS